MEYELKDYYRVKYALVCARQSFLKNLPKDDFEEYAKKIIDRAYFIIPNKIDVMDETKNLAPCCGAFFLFFIRHSYKGNHSKNPNFTMPREPRKRGKGKKDKKKCFFRGNECI